MSNWSKLDQLLVRLTEGDVPGCGVVVMQNNQVVHEAYAGYADVERGIKVDENSIFRHASSTKLFTYVIGMMLYEEGGFVLPTRSEHICRSGRNRLRWYTQGGENGRLSRRSGKLRSVMLFP